MGLLDYLTTPRARRGLRVRLHARADRDASARRPGELVRRSATRRRVGVVGAVVMALFAVLVVTAAVQTSRNSVSDERERRELAAQVERRPQPGSTATQPGSPRLQRQTVRRCRHGSSRNDASAQGLLDQLDLLRRARPARSPVRGPGVRVVADDAPGRRHRPQRGARHRPADAGQRALGGRCRGDLPQRPAADQPEHDPPGRWRHHGQRPLAAPRRTSLRDRQQGHAAGTFRGNLQRSGMVGPAARGRPAS